MNAVECVECIDPPGGTKIESHAFLFECLDPRGHDNESHVPLWRARVWVGVVGGWGALLEKVDATH